MKKRIGSVILSLLMVLSVGIPTGLTRQVKAEEDTIDGKVIVTSYTDNYFETPNASKTNPWNPSQAIPATAVFCISANRDEKNEVLSTKDMVLWIKNTGSKNYSSLTAEFEGSAKNDLTVKLNTTSMNAGSSVKATINFNEAMKSKIAAGNISSNLILKSNGTVIKRISYKYITPCCSLRSVSRGTSNQIYKPDNQKITILNDSGESWSNLTASFTADESQDDDYKFYPNQLIYTKLNKTTVANGERVEVTYNFDQTYIPPHLSQGVKLQLKDSSGAVKYSCDFQYETSGYRMEHHANPTYYTNLWNGSMIYIGQGTYSKVVGRFDLLKSNPSIKVTYKAETLVQPGKNVGTKRFTLPSNGGYYFYRKYNSKTKKYTYYYSVTAKYQKNGQKNTVTVRMKDKQRTKMLKELKAYGEVDGYDIFDGLNIEYTDGSIEGGGAAPLYLVIEGTRRPLGRVTTKKKYRKKTSAKISWSKMSSASGYTIYRSTKKNSGYKKIAKVSSKKTSYVSKKLKRKKTYYFKVKAYRKIGKKNYYSSYSYALKV